MDVVLRATAIYFFLLLLFRLSGKRTFAEVTPFDFILMLIIAETTQQGLVGQDFSVTNTLLLVVTLVGIDIALSLFKGHFDSLTKLVEDQPVILLKEGQLLKDRMRKARVDEGDILSAARKYHGLERLDQIKYAVLEQDGGISIVPQ